MAIKGRRLLLETAIIPLRSRCKPGIVTSNRIIASAPTAYAKTAHSRAMMDVCNLAEASLQPKILGKSWLCKSFETKHKSTQIVLLPKSVNRSKDQPKILRPQIKAPKLFAPEARNNSGNYQIDTRSRISAVPMNRRKNDFEQEMIVRRKRCQKQIQHWYS